MKSSFNWNNDNISQLVTLYAKGYSAKEIAKQIGAPSRNSVIGKAWRLGLKSKCRPLLSIGRNECRWPVEGRLFCGDKTGEGDAYCAVHKEKARRKSKVSD